MKKYLFALLFLSLWACKKEDSVSSTRELREETVILQYLQENQINAQRSPDGIYYFFQRQNNQARIQPGDSVKVDYTGSILYGKTFDSSHFRGETLNLRVGVSNLIEAWHKTLPLMRKGEKMTIITPSRWAYGVGGKTPWIPSYAILKFEIEVKEHFPQ